MKGSGFRAWECCGFNIKGLGFREFRDIDVGVFDFEDSGFRVQGFETSIQGFRVYLKPEEPTFLRTYIRKS